MPPLTSDIEDHVHYTIGFVTELALAVTPAAFAQQQATAGASPSAAQVQQLRQELSKMQAETDAMQKSMQAGNIPLQQLQTIQQHMNRMRTYQQQMHTGCFGVNPSGYGCGMMEPRYLEKRAAASL